MKRYILPLLIAFIGIAFAEPRPVSLSPTVSRAAIVKGLKRLSTVNALHNISLEGSNPRGFYAGRYKALADAAEFLETQGFPEEADLTQFHPVKCEYRELPPPPVQLDEPTPEDEPEPEGEPDPLDVVIENIGQR